MKYAYKKIILNNNKNIFRNWDTRQSFRSLYREQKQLKFIRKIHQAFYINQF